MLQPPHGETSSSTPQQVGGLPLAGAGPVSRAPGSPPPEASRQAPHNQFLDLVRTVAILRVLAWHTYGYAWLSYFVASMPAMFFVAGSLMAHSLERGSVRHVLVARFRRLLIPLWVFAIVALAVMTRHGIVHPEMGEPLRWSQIPWWVFPVWDPQGSDWGVTFWAVLWYMRCLTWLLLLSPILVWLYRRLSVQLILLPLSALILFEILSRSGEPVSWQFEDLALFGIFWILGFSYNAGTLARLSTPARALATLVFAAASAWWVLTQDVPNMVVNASYPAHLLVGLTWLFAALTFERPLARFASRATAARFIGWVNDRIFTIYLWHAAGLFAMYEILWAVNRPRWLRDAAALPIVLAVTWTCMLAFGWIEDIAARRELHFTPRSGQQPARAATKRRAPAFLVPSVAAVGLSVLLGALLTEHFHTSTSIPASAAAVPPSGAGIEMRAKRAVILDAPPPSPSPTPNAEGPASAPVTGAELQRLLEGWRIELGIGGTTLAIRRSDGTAWSGAAGTDADTGFPLNANRRYPIASVTKTFTVAMILQLVEEGKVGLDERASHYVTGIAHSGDYTVQQLIQHTSGLMATDGVAPAAALLAATRTPLAFAPGTQFLYSSPGYFMLGLIIEKVTGLPYTAALHERLIDPLGLSATRMDEEVAPLDASTHPVSNAALRSSSGVLRSSSGIRAVGTRFEYYGVLWSSAGLQSTVADLASWAIDLWDSDAVVSEATRRQMTTFLGSEFQYAGLGTYPFCPCWVENGALQGERWGHYGRSGVLEYDPRDRIAVAIYTSGTDIDERLIVAYDDLSQRVRDLLRNRALVVHP